MWKLLLLIPLLFVLGCPSASTPTPPLPPDPPQVRVLRYATLGAEANVAVAGTLKVLCTPAPPAVPALDASTCSNTAVYVRTVAATFDKVSDEAKSSDPWSTMRAKIAGIVTTVATSMTVSDPNLRAQIIGLQSYLQQILEVK